MQQLSRYCTTGDYVPIKGVAKERAELYRRLVYDQVKGTLERAFPIAFSFLPDEWVDRFLAEHPSTTPYLWRMPYEFYQYMNQVDHGFVHLDDLLLFEWVEIDIELMKNQPMPTPDAGHLAVNPEHQLLHLKYPVHKMIKGAEEHEGDYFILVFRNLDKRAEFIELSPLCALILATLDHTPMSSERVLGQIGDAHKDLDKSDLMRYGIGFIDEMCRQAVLVLGE